MLGWSGIGIRVGRAAWGLPRQGSCPRPPRHSEWDEGFAAPRGASIFNLRILKFAEMKNVASEKANSREPGSDWDEARMRRTGPRCKSHQGSRERGVGVHLGKLFFLSESVLISEVPQ